MNMGNWAPPQGWKSNPGPLGRGYFTSDPWPLENPGKCSIIVILACGVGAELPVRMQETMCGEGMENVT